MRLPARTAVTHVEVTRTRQRLLADRPTLHLYFLYPACCPAWYVNEDDEGQPLEEVGKYYVVWCAYYLGVYTVW